MNEKEIAAQLWGIAEKLQGGYYGRGDDFDVVTLDQDLDELMDQFPE